MKDAEKARKLLDVISVVASNVVEKRLDNVVQTKLAYVTSITYNTNGSAIYRVRLSSSNSDEFECPKLCINELSVGDYVWLNYIGDITNAYIAMPVEPSPAQDVIRNTVAYNLLDNSDFTNPVNQRGKTTYTGTASAYTIDRWYINRASTKVLVNAASVSIDNTSEASNTSIISQRLTPPKPGVYTLAAGTTEGVLFAQYTFDGTAVAKIDSLDGANANIQLAYANDLLIAQIRVQAGKTATIEWIALYAGEYTAETLPKYMPKGYAVEFSECRRCFNRMRINGLSVAVGGGANLAYGTFFMPVPMRVTPTATATLLGSLRSNGSSFSISGISSVAQHGTNVHVAISGTFTGAGNHSGSLMDTSIDFSADW